jgi:C4-dicarboxylate-binding protein DctP
MEGLPADVRTQFSQILKEVTTTRNAEAAAVNADAKQLVIKAGGTVRTLTPEQRAQWIATMKPVWKKFEKDIGADTIESAVAANATN